MTPADPDATPGVREMRLRDLRPVDEPVAVVARVVSATRREVTRKSDGGRRPVLSGLLSDGTGTARFTWWDPPHEEIPRGTVIRAVGASVGEYRGRAELTFNWRTRVAPANEAELPVLAADEIAPRTLAELGERDEGFQLDARVVRSVEKRVKVDDEWRSVHEGLLADKSSHLAFTAWVDFGLKPGEAVRIRGGYVRAFRGRRQLVLDERSHLERISGSELPSLAEVEHAVPRRVADLERDRGGEFVETSGTVVGLSPPSGLVYRCPTCQRAVVKGMCRVHGVVTGEPDLRARLVLDDGTGALTVELGRPETERWFGRTLPEVLASLAAHPDPAAIEEALFNAVFGLHLVVRGPAAADDFGVTVRPESVERADPVPPTAVASLRGRIAPEAA